MDHNTLNSSKIVITFNYKNGHCQKITYPYNNLDAAKKWSKEYAEFKEVEDYIIRVGDQTLPIFKVKERV